RWCRGARPAVRSRSSRAWRPPGGFDRWEFVSWLILSLVGEAGHWQVTANPSRLGLAKNRVIGDNSTIARSAPEEPHAQLPSLLADHPVPGPVLPPRRRPSHPVAGRAAAALPGPVRVPLRPVVPHLRRAGPGLPGPVGHGRRAVARRHPGGVPGRA